MPTPAVVPAPAGSDSVDMEPFTELISSSALNSLANGSSSSTLSYSNPSSATLADVTLDLDAITPSGATPQMKISDGTTEYYIDVSTTNVRKIVTFVNIPTTFLSSFTVVNSTGVALASKNNYIFIMPK